MTGNQPDDYRRSFQSAYDGRPPWEIGRAQPVFVELADDGSIEGSVLDVGCGTGENALMLAERGHDVLGVDTAETAIDRARAKARERGLDARFRVHDANELASLDERFDTIIDSGLFHVLVHDDPLRYAASLRSVIRDGGRLFVLGFDSGQEGQGPSISRDDLRRTFIDGWEIKRIEESVYETVGVPGHKDRALLATIRATD